MSMNPEQHPAFAPPVAYAPPLVRPTSGMAVTALILSILWGFGLLSLIAVALAWGGWKDTKSGVKSGHGLNVAALIIGILGLIGPAFGIFVLLVGEFSGGA